MSRIELDISFTNLISWHKSGHCNFYIAEQADVWLIKATDNLHLLNTFAAVLNKDETARANRYLRKEDHNRFIISRASLRYILSNYINVQPAAIIFELEPNKKPYIPDTAIQYNLSDSGDQILIAISRQPVGIDVEYIKPKFYYDTILPLNFNSQEIAFINEVDSSQRFFMLWTRKEAILKATGIGLTDHLKQIPSLDGRHIINGGLVNTQSNWKLSSFMVDESYIGTIAAAAHGVSYNFYEFNLKEFLH